MNCLKKTIVLSNKKDGYRALCVLTLLKSRQGTFGAFRSEYSEKLSRRI